MRRYLEKFCQLELSIAVAKAQAVLSEAALLRAMFDFA
jgi:hypothetical protein